MVLLKLRGPFCVWESLKLENPGSVLSSGTKNVPSFLPTVNGFRGSGRLRSSKGFSGLILRAETMLTDGFVNKFTFRHFSVWVSKKSYISETPPFNPHCRSCFGLHHRIRDSIAEPGCNEIVSGTTRSFVSEKHVALQSALIYEQISKHKRAAGALKKSAFWGTWSILGQVGGRGPGVGWGGGVFQKSSALNHLFQEFLVT